MSAETTLTQQQALDAVRCLSIPLSGGQLLVPHTAVAEVTGFEPPAPVPNAPAWLSGMLRWRGIDVPVIAYERLLENAADGYRPERIVVLNTLNGNPKLPFVAVLVSGIPRLIVAEQAGIEEVEPLQDEPPALLRRVKMAEGEFIIPDLDALEQMVLRLGL